MVSCLSVVQTIYFVILIVIALFILLPLLRSSWSSNDEGEDSTEEKPATPAEETKEDAKERPRSAPRAYSPPDREISIAKPEDISRGASIITHKEFRNTMLNPTFLQEYTEAIRTSMITKLGKYRVKLRQLSADLATGGNSLFEHNTRVSRLNKIKAEIVVLISTIERRLRALNVADVSAGLLQAFDDVHNGIASLTGREEIKDFLALQIYTFAKNPRIFFTNFQNMALYGTSGVGKSKLATTIAFVYAKSGILARDKVRCITKHELTTAYVNESAQLVRECLVSTLEGVLFIDEAYDLTPPIGGFGRSVDHGMEAITEMVNFLDKHIGLSVVIVAGYEDEMEERFMKANQGIPRRFPHVVRLGPYNSDQLTDILLGFIAYQAPGLDLDRDDETCNFIHTIVSGIYAKDARIFDRQAGDMQNLSGQIVKAIYGSDRDWRKKDNREALVVTGFNLFLVGKGVGVVVSPSALL